MKFQRTRRTLDYYSSKERISIADLLGIMNDAIGDIQAETRSGADQLETGELRDLITRMSAVGHVLLQIQRSKSGDIASVPERQESVGHTKHKISVFLNITSRL